MTSSFEQNNQTNEQITEGDFFRYKNEIQILLMINAGIDPDNNASVQEWIDSNAVRLENIFNQEMASKYQKNPTEATEEIRIKLYH